jgi:hypothetical protein
MPRTVPPGDARLSRNSTLPAGTGMVPAKTEAVSISLDPTGIRLLETARLVVVCAAAVAQYRRPIRSIRAELV